MSIYVKIPESEEAITNLDYIYIDNIYLAYDVFKGSYFILG